MSPPLNDPVYAQMITSSAWVTALLFGANHDPSHRPLDEYVNGLGIVGSNTFDDMLIYVNGPSRALVDARLRMDPAHRTDGTPYVRGTCDGPDDPLMLPPIQSLVPRRLPRSPLN